MSGSELIFTEVTDLYQFKSKQAKLNKENKKHFDKNERSIMKAN